MGASWGAAWGRVGLGQEVRETIRVVSLCTTWEL